MMKSLIDYVTLKDEPKITESLEDIENKILSGENIQKDKEKKFFEKAKDKFLSTKAAKNLQLASEKRKYAEINNKALKDTEYSKTLGVVEKPKVSPPSERKEQIDSEIQREKQRAIGTGTSQGYIDKAKDLGSQAVDKAKDLGSQAVDKAKDLGSQAKDVIMKNPEIALGAASVAAAGGLGYLAYKKFKQRQAAKKAAMI